MDILKTFTQYLNPEQNPDLQCAFDHSQEHLPTLWLLGKTGAGKSSLVQALTGLDAATIGNGFRPCTMTSEGYAFPEQTPLLVFLDTRGLGEAEYDAKDDIDACEQGSQALVVVMKADDAEQSAVLKALVQIKRSKKIHHMLLVHSGIDLLPATERQRCIQHQQSLVKAVWGDVRSIAVDFTAVPVALGELVDAIGELLPIVAELFERQTSSSQEETKFLKLKTEIMWYAGAAGASDAVPVLGLVSVPSIQAKLLHSLANQYGLEWNWRLLSELAGTLGISFGAQYASRLGLQQLAKLIPGYGQTIGALSAAALSYATTYALGRVACMYFHAQQRGEKVAPEDLQARFQQAFAHIQPVAKDSSDENAAAGETQPKFWQVFKPFGSKHEK